MRKSRTSAKSAKVAVKRATRTSVPVDERLVAKVMRMSKAKSTADAVTLALDHYARAHNYSKVLTLYGMGGVADGYDPKLACSR
jgi:ribosomal protein S7